MASFIEYVLKTGISLAVLYMFYWLFLRKDTHFKLNRVVLVFSILFSAILPSMHIGIFSTPHVFESFRSFTLEFSRIEPLISEGIETNSFPTAEPVNYWKFLLIVYMIGVCTVFARLIYQAIFLHAVSRMSEKINYNGYSIITMNTDMTPFSYFNRIYVPSSKMDEGSFDNIIAHERSHLNQGHYIDLFIIEIMTMFQWFNPVIWLYEKSIKEVHEYLADEDVLSKGEDQGKYQAHLVNQALGGPVFILTSQFNQSLIKKRIMMMKKMKTSHAAKFKVLLILPIVTGLLLAFTMEPARSFSDPDRQNSTITGNVTDESTGMPIPGGIISIRGTTTGTITDKEGNYSIDIGNTIPVLVFSHVGYKSQEIPVESNTKINVQLEREVLAVDFSGGNKLNPNMNSPENKQNSTNANNDLYVVKEELPSYPGGTDALKKYLMDNLRYPSEAKKKGIQGKVMVNFVINAAGAVTDVKIMRGVSSELDAEAMRLVSSVKGWKPASHNGEHLSTAVTMPVEFKIQ